MVGELMHLVVYKWVKYLFSDGVGENQQVNAVEIYLVEQFTTMENLSVGFS